MERKLFQIVVGSTWLALPLTALNYWRAWDLLPARVAVHFDINWRPNGWTSREGSLMLALGTTAFLVVIFTIASYAMSRTPVSTFAKWSMVVVFYVVLGFVYYVNNWIVDRNLRAVA
jgi:ABC-type maltose transport system permease subunit